MKASKAYAHGKHAVGEAQKYAPHAVLKVFKDAKGQDIAQISLHRLVQRFEDFVDKFEPKAGDILVLLSGIEDPHNVGAIIRSAAAFGATAILLPTHSQAPITDTVFKVSAGMAFRVPLVVIDNLQQALGALKKKGVKIYGLEARGKGVVSELQGGEARLFIFGNEGEGINKSARVLCDEMLSIPMDPRCESLNVAAAAAITLFAARLPAQAGTSSNAHGS